MVEATPTLTPLAPRARRRAGSGQSVCRPWHSAGSAPRAAAQRLLRCVVRTTKCSAAIAMQHCPCSSSSRAGTSLCTCLYTRNLRKRQVHFQSLD